MRAPCVASLLLALTLASCDDSASPLSDDNGGPGGGGPGPGSSTDRQCTGVVVGGTYEEITVPAGASCTLRDVIVTGNVVALRDARLVIESSRVDGNIQGENAALVHVHDGRVGGNLQIHDGSSPGELGVSVTGSTVLTNGNLQVTKMRTGRILIADAMVQKGNLQVEDNVVASALDVLRNAVAQNLEVRKHSGNAEKEVRGNRVEQTLECKENDPRFIGGPNTAGEFVGQCH